MDLMLLASCDLNEGKLPSLQDPVTGRRFRLSERSVGAQIGHNNFKRQKGKSSCSIVIVTGLEGAFSNQCWTSYHSMFYPDGVREILAQKLTME